MLLFSHAVLYDAWRQLLFLYAPLTVIATIGFAEIFPLLSKNIRILFGICVGLGLVWTLVTMIQLHPYEYVYFNQIIGGTKRAYGRYELDYWGESFKEASQWINQNKNTYMALEDKTAGGKLLVWPCIPMLAQNYLGSNIIINSAEAVIYYCIDRPSLHNPGFSKILHIVQRHGVILNIIYSK